MKVLFIGLGGIGQRHLRILKKILPDAKISAVRHSGRVNEITDTLQLNSDVNIERKYDIDIYTSIEEAVIDKPDFAIVANPTSLHVETAFELVKNKIPVLLEKPISNTDNKVDDLVELSLKNSTPVMIAFMMRFHPCVIQLEKYIKDELNVELEVFNPFSDLMSDSDDCNSKYTTALGLALGHKE